MSAVNLSLGFGSKTVLDQVNLSFRPRAVTSLLGPTGSGKSTFLRTLNRMNDKVSGYRRSGDVLLDGQSIFKIQDLMEFRRRVGMLFQRPNPFPMSIIDNVVAGVRAHKLVPRKEFRAIAEARLREVGLWDAVKDRLGDSPYRLSGGQQQLLCLARASGEPRGVAARRAHLLAGPDHHQKIQQLIRSLANRLAVIMVTHDLAQASRIGDRTALFFDGRLIEEGPTEQLFLAPKHAETARYIPVYSVIADFSEWWWGPPNRESRPGGQKVQKGEAHEESIAYPDVRCAGGVGRGSLRRTLDDRFGCPGG